MFAPSSDYTEGVLILHIKPERSPWQIQMDTQVKVVEAAPWRTPTNLIFMHAIT